MKRRFHLNGSALLENLIYCNIPRNNCLKHVLASDNFVGPGICSQCETGLTMPRIELLFLHSSGMAYHDVIPLNLYDEYCFLSYDILSYYIVLYYDNFITIFLLFSNPQLLSLPIFLCLIPFSFILLYIISVYPHEPLSLFHFNPHLLSFVHFIPLLTPKAGEIAGSSLNALRLGKCSPITWQEGRRRWKLDYKRLLKISKPRKTRMKISKSTWKNFLWAFVP